MFNIGGGELLVIALIALIVLGPQRLPDAARTVGRVMGDLRRISSGFQQELRDAFDPTDVDTDEKDTPRRKEATPLAATVAETDAKAADAVADATPPDQADAADDGEAQEPAEADIPAVSTSDASRSDGSTSDAEVDADASGPGADPDAGSTVAPAVAAALDEIVAPLPTSRASTSPPAPDDQGGATAAAPDDRGDGEGLGDHRAAS
jgi:sec-independent protein translocase protein TatB